jgi:hypothetical protein
MATILTRRNLYLEQRGDVPSEALWTAFRKAGAFAPLVKVFLERVTKSVTEFVKLVDEKSSQVEEEDEAKAARAFRERAAAGSCLICLDDNPNIATLCCGKAVHLNCMAEWLASKNSCPQCRGHVPALPERMRAPPPAQDDHDIGFILETTTTTSEEDEVDQTSEETTDDITTEETVAVEDSTTDETTAVQDTAAPPAPNEDSTSTTEEDTEVTTEQHAATDETTTTEDAVSDTTTTVPTPRQIIPPKCAVYHCRNRSALGCSNNFCGRCCVLRGEYQCLRHNT